MGITKRLCEAKTLNELNSVLGEGLKQKGIKYYAYQLNKSAAWDSRRPLIVSSYPEKWVNYYIDRKYNEIDPVINTLGKSVSPFLWSRVWRNNKLSRKQEMFFNEAEDYGISQGIGIPVLSAGQGNGVVTLVADMKQKDALHLFNDSIYEISLWATHFHYSVINCCSKTKINTLNLDVFKLTLRELDIIKWSAESKTFSEIGTILGISHNTVMFHVKNIYRKMEVQSRQEMVVKAIMNGIVSI